jgi:hypothetical protein
MEEHEEKEAQVEEDEQDTVADSQPDQDSPQFLPPPPPFKLDRPQHHAQEKATLGRSWSTATTVLMMENTPRSPPPLTRESIKRKDMSPDWEQEEDEIIPSSQIMHQDSMGGVARTLFTSKTDGGQEDQTAAKKRKVSVVKRTIGVL